MSSLADNDEGRGNILVSITLDDSRDMRGIDPPSVRGNIEILVDDTFIRLGSYDGALLLLATTEALAEAVLRVRSEHKTVEIDLISDTPSLWIMQPRKGASDRIVLAYRDIRTAPVLRKHFDKACEQAVGRFLESVLAPLGRWDWTKPLVETLNHIGVVWPDLTRLWARAQT